MFRYKRGMDLSYEMQGYIYFVSKRYKSLDKKSRERIDRICERASEKYSAAVFEYMTSGADATYICRKHYISPATLERTVKRYYNEFYKEFLK